MPLRKRREAKDGKVSCSELLQSIQGRASLGQANDNPNRALKFKLQFMTKLQRLIN